MVATAPPLVPAYMLLLASMAIADRYMERAEMIVVVVPSEFSFRILPPDASSHNMYSSPLGLKAMVEG